MSMYRTRHVDIVLQTFLSCVCCTIQYNTVARFCTACVHMSYPHAHHPLFLIFLLTVFVDGATYKSGSTSALSINRGCKLLLSKNYK